MSEIIIVNEEEKFIGCDFVVQLGKERENTEIRLLQITDTQVIDSLQRRTPDRIRVDEIKAWQPKYFDGQCGNHIRSLIAQTKPDLIFITGDIVYGSFDDAGSTFNWFCDLMDSFQIPWAPVFGNHDNESKKGVIWQCKRFEESKYCIFRRGEVSGNSNYTVGIATGDKIVRVLHMMDSNGCVATEDPEVIKEKKIFSDQLQLIEKNSKAIEKSQGKKVPAFIAFHIPTEEFKKAEIEKGYLTEKREYYVLGVNVASVDGDFGARLENYSVASVEGDFLSFLKSQKIDGVFCGHYHSNNTCILYEGIRWVFGLKTGQYDGHTLGSIGGTMVRICGESFCVNHIPALVSYSPFPYGAPMFNTIFVEKD